MLEEALLGAGRGAVGCGKRRCWVREEALLGAGRGAVECWKRRC